MALLCSILSVGLLSWLTYLTSLRNLGDEQIFNVWKQEFRIEFEDKLRAEKAVAEQSQTALRAELKDDIADAKDTAKRALAKPGKAILVANGGTPLPVQVVTPALTPTPVPTPSVTDTNPKRHIFSW